MTCVIQQRSVCKWTDSNNRFYQKMIILFWVCDHTSVLGEVLAEINTKAVMCHEQSAYYCTFLFQAHVKVQP